MLFQNIVQFSQWIEEPEHYQPIREQFISLVRDFHNGTLIPDDALYNIDAGGCGSVLPYPVGSELNAGGCESVIPHPAGSKLNAGGCESVIPHPAGSRSTREGAEAYSRVQPVQLNTASRPLSDRPAAIKANNALKANKVDKGTTQVKKQASTHTPRGKKQASPHTPRDDSPKTLPSVSITSFDFVFSTLQC
jgi:hypothetical protein